MPIKFNCPNCQHAIEVSRQHAGQAFACPQCQAAVRAPGTPSPAPAQGAPAQNDPAAHRTRRHVAPIQTMAVKLLWLGMILVMLTFGIKHLLVDAAASSLPSALEVPRLLAQRNAELFPHRDATRELQEEYNDARERAWEDDNFRGDDTPEMERLQAQIESARSDASDEIEKIEEKYEEKLEKAELAAINSAASGIGWIQRGIWIKLLVDLPKMAGCFLIVIASMMIVCDPEQDSHVKIYATASSTVILLYTTAYAFMAFMS